ncbi:MAG TPA: DUF4142 domain-containing protein [Lacipirellulaceae bacterium]|nr:DUF4142 domain-containing protein [Lacipirellulaceae bacterium]
MSAQVKLRVGAIAAGMSCLLLGSVFAQQQSEPTHQVKPTQYQGNLPGQATQNNSTQPNQGNNYTRTGQRYTANYGGEQAGQKSVDRYLASCLSANNRGEIEIAKLAEQQSQNAQVKQFAQQLVKDHQQLQQQLDQLPSLRVATGQNATSEVGTQGETGRATGEAARPESNATTTTETNQTSNVNPTAGASAMIGGGIYQIAKIDQQITQRFGQMLKEDLQQKSGAAFDQAFLGAMIGNHIHAIAAVEVISQNTQGQMQQLAQQARPTFQQHLDRAKQLMKELGSNENASQAERSSSRTQR